MSRVTAICAVLAIAACGGPFGGDGDGPLPGDEDLGAAGGNYTASGSLETAAGCAGVFNPDQIVDYHLTMTEANWSALTHDTTNSVYYPANLACGGMLPIRVAVRRKRSGGTEKVGLKIDVNEIVAGQTYFGLAKLSLENGISESPTGTIAVAGARDLLAEYLSWRAMQRSQAIASRAALARVFINGRLLGAYVHVEQVDKKFLLDRLGDNSGWLFKFSGSAGDGQQTNEGVPDPYAAYFCFFEKSGCAAPAAATLAAELPAKLDIDQMLRMGAVNAILANTDAPLLKMNNYLYYDYAGGPRMYFPWDLDTTMKAGYDVFVGPVSGGTTVFTDVLYTSWRDDYKAILSQLVQTPLTPAAIDAELQRAVTVAGSAIDGDPYLDGDAAGAAAELSAWYRDQHAAVRAQLTAN